MPTETIDTHEALILFHQLMQTNSPVRVLRLNGHGKMGKTHLLTKVFPILVQQDYQALSAIVDLNRPFQTIPDILSQICIQLDEQNFVGYYAADQAWSNRPKVDVRGLTATFSKVDIFAKDNDIGVHDRARILTIEFTRDIRKLRTPLVVLLFDSIDQASEEIQAWIMGTLLISISRFSHIRVVTAGRFLPETHGSYRALCRDYQLLPIKDVKAYLDYCESINPDLSERDISVLAQAFDYTPGFVAEALRKFIL
jgi:hypothetical protein